MEEAFDHSQTKQGRQPFIIVTIMGVAILKLKEGQLFKIDIQRCF